MSLGGCHSSERSQKSIRLGRHCGQTWQKVHNMMHRISDSWLLSILCCFVSSVVADFGEIPCMQRWFKLTLLDSVARS